MISGIVPVILTNEDMQVWVFNLMVDSDNKPIQFASQSVINSVRYVFFINTGRILNYEMILCKTITRARCRVVKRSGEKSCYVNSAPV